MPEDQETIQEAEYTITEVPSNLAVLQSAEISSQVATAKAYPRSIVAFKRRALSLATMSQDVAESCEYALPRGNKMIKGPSVRLAEIVYTSYGNCRAAARVVNNNGRTVTAQGIFFDMEMNTVTTIEVSRSIMQHEWKDGRRTGKMVPMNEDMQVMIGNAACSVALRNAVFRGIPKAAWTEVYDKAKVVAMGDAETLPDRRAKAIAFFVGKGVKEEQIFTALDVKGTDDIDLEKLATLSAMKSTVANNEASIDSIFPKPTPKDPGAAATNAVEEKLKAEQLKKENKAKSAAAATLEKMKAGLADDKKTE